MKTVSFDQAVTYYDSTRGYPAGVPEQIRDAIVQHTQANATTRFLELGIGTGLIGLPFMQAGYPYVGVDISVPMMVQLQEKLASTNQPQLLQADITRRLPLPERWFDVVSIMRVMHVLDDWQGAIAAVKRVLKPGGTLLIAKDVRLEDSNPALAVHGQWDEILAELGIMPKTIRPGLWLDDATIIEHLQGTGATTQVVDLLTYDSSPLSIRMMAERHKQRWYSRDWELSDAIHTEAVKRLDVWLDTEAVAPDKAVSTPTTFRAISARWAG